MNFISPGATMVAFLALGILVLWDSFLTKKAKIFQLIQGPLVAVAVGILFYYLSKDNAALPQFGGKKGHLEGLFCIKF